MDSRSQNILNSNRELIIKDIHGDVIDNLKLKGVLSLQEYETIVGLESHEERNGKLLDTLLAKKDGLEQFVDTLREWYWWIADKLKESLKAPSAVWEDAISSCNIPSVPARNVSRCVLLDKVRASLKRLRKGHYVVLHGMSGCGKSSLAVEAIRDELFIEQFQGKVCWLSCGQKAKSEKETADDENQILGLMLELNEWICNDELIYDLKQPYMKTLNIKLRKRFHASDFREGIIVLDDVNSDKVIKALNIGCKTLVTTNDINVMKEHAGHCEPIKITEGFTEEESMCHLALCVGIPVEQLPSQAGQIHKNGKGHPLIISLIGAQLSDHAEEVRKNPEAWKPYLDVLVNRDYGELMKRRSNGGVSSMSETFELCLNNLRPEMREKYQDFALFVEDINIKTEVLEILWDLPRFKVKDIMEEFHTKSLIVRKYNSNQNYYVYGIHDLLLYHVKMQLDENALQALHLKLINRYQQVCNGDFAHLPKNDNYFFYYIGYHIANAKKYKLFPEWYFNLDFIEAKLKVAGPGDLLSDYKRYSSHFMESYDKNATARKLTDFATFVESAGLDVRKNFDIIQLALQEPHDSEVYKTALRIVQSRPNSIYLRFQLGPSKSRSAPHIIPTKEKVSCACFSKNINDIIVGFESGIIQIMNKKGYITRIYEGHTKKVTGLRLLSAKDIFLSVSDNCVKLWKLPDLDSSVSTETGNRTPSPSQRQIDFTDIFNHKTVDRRTCWLSFDYTSPVTWACFSTDGLKFASCCSQEYEVEVQEINGQNVLKINVLDNMPTCCVFSQNNELLIIGCSTSKILIYGIYKKFECRLSNSFPLLALFSMPGNNLEMNFGALTKSTLNVWEIDNEHYEERNKKKLDIFKSEGETYIDCAAAPDGSYVAVATHSGKIQIFDLKDGSMIHEMSHSNGNIKYLAMDESKDHMLLACYDDATIRLWTLEDIHYSKQAIMKTNFVVAWGANNIPIIAAPTIKSSVRKMYGDIKSEDLEVPVKGEISICGISKCGKYIVTNASTVEIFLHYENCEMKMIKILTVEKQVMKLLVEIFQDIVYVVIGLDKSLMVWMCKRKDILEPGKCEKFEVSLNAQLIQCFIHPVKQEFITVSSNGSVKKWCLNTGTVVMDVCEARSDVTICEAAFTCSSICTLDSRRMLLNIHHLEKNMMNQSIELTNSPTCCSFSMDGKILAVGYQNGIIETRNVDSSIDKVRVIKQTDEPIESVCVSNKGLLAASTKSRVVVVTVKEGIGQAKLGVQRVVMSPDDTTIVTVDTYGHMHFIDTFNDTSSNTFQFLRKPIALKVQVTAHKT